MDSSAAKELLAPFDPADRRYAWRLWVRVVTPAEVFYHLYWRRLAVAAAGLGLVLWLLGAAGVWAFVKYGRGHETVRYADLALYPWRATQYRESLGRYYFAQGLAEVEAKNYMRGYELMLAGLARAPADLEIRRKVAMTEIRLGVPHRALETLARGAAAASDDLNYQKLVFALLLEAREDQRAIDLAHAMLPARPDGVLAHQFVALQLATAHFNRGHYAEAERVLEAWGLGDSAEGTVLLAKCDWERGYSELALVRLERDLTRFARPDGMYVELGRMLRELGRADESRRVALMRHLRDPESPGPRVGLIRMLRMTGQPEAERIELEDYLRDFGRDPLALTLLGWLAVDTLQPELMERAYRLAQAQNAPLRALQLARVELALAQQEYRRAEGLAAEALPALYDSEDSMPAHFRALQALARLGAGDFQAGEMTLRSLLLGVRLRANDAMLIGSHLRRMEQTTLARDFLVSAVQLDPKNESALTQLVRLDAAAGNRDGLAEFLPKLLQFPKPPRAVLKETLLQLNAPEDAGLRLTLQATLGRLPTRTAISSAQP